MQSDAKGLISKLKQNYLPKHTELFPEQSEDGAIYLVRHLKWDRSKILELVSLLNEIADARSDTIIEREKLIQMVWDLPFFFSEYRMKILACGNDAEHELVLQLRSAVKRIIGSHNWLGSE